MLPVLANDRVTFFGKGMTPMNKSIKLAAVSVLALAVAAPAFAQSRVTGIQTLNDDIDDITTDVNRDLRRGTSRSPLRVQTATPRPVSFPVRAA